MSAVPWQAVSLLRGFPRFGESERLGVRCVGDAGLGWALARAAACPWLSLTPRLYRKVQAEMSDRME